MPIYEELSHRLSAYAAGERTQKAGFSDLELFLAREKQGKLILPEDVDQALAALVESGEAHDEDFAMGISLIAEKLGTEFGRYRDALERTLFGADVGLSPRSEFELASEFVRCEGDFGPKQLNQLVLLKNQLPELWIDLALDAYPNDVKGLTVAITDLFDDPCVQISWSALKSRYLKLIGAVGNRHFNKFVLDVAESLSDQEQDSFTNWVNTKRGSSLEPQKAFNKIASPEQQTRAMRDIEFLTERPSLAKPVAQKELEAA